MAEIIKFCISCLVIGLGKTVNTSAHSETVGGLLNRRVTGLVAHFFTLGGFLQLIPTTDYIKKTYILYLSCKIVSTYEMLPKIRHYTLNLRPDNAVRMRSGYYPVSNMRQQGLVHFRHALSLQENFRFRSGCYMFRTNGLLWV